MQNNIREKLMILGTILITVLCVLFFREGAKEVVLLSIGGFLGLLKIDLKEGAPKE